MPRRESKTTPWLYAGTLYDAEESFSIQDAKKWHAWLSSNRTFYAKHSLGTFTARRDQRSGGWYWYAYRRKDGRLKSLYLGPSHELTEERIAWAAAELDRRLNASSPGR